jgi:hypothetical protein
VSSFYYNDWCTFNDGEVTINDYDSYETPISFKEALKSQAKLIDETNSNYVVFMSGGIDSQTKALGFILAGIDVKLVIIRNTFEGKSNDIEVFYAQQFCDKYNVPLTIYDMEYTRDSIQDLLLEKNYVNSSMGAGIIFQFDAIKHYVKETGSKIVTGHGHFSFVRKGKTCSGYFRKPDCGTLVTIDTDNVIVFDMYAPYVFKYYEHVHRTTPEIQLLPDFEAKNLSYTEIGMPFRPKLSGYEFLCPKDHLTLSTIDFSNDHSKAARLSNGAETILNAVGITNNKDIISNKPKMPPSGFGLAKLYSFESEINFP